MLFEKLLRGEESLSVVGLGYVGMPLAVAFAKKVKVIGFDLNQQKVQQYLDGIDPTMEVGDEAIRNTTVAFTSDPAVQQEVDADEVILLQALTPKKKVLDCSSE